ncbi:hypothetical protein IGI04_023674 [Brassica rapa subsp. trilocularis]|uniref:Uncharacterized protein n=1 Tax=Brassica rapa subsp. trilocularis TaxID=1813537 RepID=A0ABQ7M8Q1_BRACM|nr:hypothetical protein IGI04_023674 [Brassica rapa subsp. trilocularis]
MQGFSNKYLDLQSKSASIAGSLTKRTCFHESSLNGGCHQVLIHVNRTLMIAATKSRSNSFCWNPYEASINGCSHQDRNREKKCDKSTQGFTFQTCLKNPISCIPSPKTSSCVKFSVGGQLWFLRTISASFTFQTCLKNPISCIPSPKTSSCVKFSVGGQLWFLRTISASMNS